MKNKVDRVQIREVISRGQTRESLVGSRKSFGFFFFNKYCGNPLDALIRENYSLI